MERSWTGVSSHDPNSSEEETAHTEARSFMYCYGTLHILYADRSFSDVTFHCDDGIQVEAHKFILASRSEHFKRALYSKGDRLDENCKHKQYGFRTASAVLNKIIEYLYTGVIAELEMEGSISEDHRVELWKSLLSEAHSKSLGGMDTYLRLLLVRRQISELPVAAAFYTFAKASGHEEIMEAMARTMTQLPFTTDSLKDLTEDALIAVLSDVPLNADELQVIKAVSVWMQENLMDEEEVNTEVLKLLDVRFLSAEDFYDHVEPLKLFDADALLEAYQRLALNPGQKTVKNTNRGADKSWASSPAAPQDDEAMLKSVCTLQLYTTFNNDDQTETHTSHDGGAAAPGKMIETTIKESEELATDSDLNMTK